MKTSRDVLETSWRSVHAEGVLISPQTDPDIMSADEAAAGLTRDQVMTAGEVADLLQMPVSTVYYLANRGDVPAKRLGRGWRFLCLRLEEFLWSRGPAVAGRFGTSACCA